MRRNPGRGGPEPQNHAEETTSETLPSPQIKDCWLTLLIGLLGIFLGVLVIILNEARAVSSCRNLQDTLTVIQHIDSNAQIDSAMVGAIIHLTGAIAVHEPVTDPDYGISVPAVKLKRRVQMLQWVEQQLEDSVSGEAPLSQYVYYTEWRDRIVDSAFFANSATHANPRDFPIKSQILVNEKITLGKYELGTGLKEQFNIYEEITSDERPENKDVKLHSGLYYHAQDIWNPEVGDLRIQFSYAGMHGQVISIIAAIDQDNRIVPFKSSTGRNLLLLRLGPASKEEMFAYEESLNRTMVWIYRVIAWFLLYIGSFYMTKVFVVLCQQAGAHPEISPGVKLGMATSIFLLVTAFAWLSYQPALALILTSTVAVVMYVTGIMPGCHQYARCAHLSQAARASRTIRAIRSAHRYDRL